VQLRLQKIFEFPCAKEGEPPNNPKKLSSFIPESPIRNFSIWAMKFFLASFGFSFSSGLASGMDTRKSCNDKLEDTLWIRRRLK